MNEELIEKIVTIVKSEIEKAQDNMGVKVGVSARHVHLTLKDLETLFGKGYELTKKKDLMGGQFAAEECVTIVGGKLSSIEKVRILGPLRSKTQVEIAQTDAVKLGVKPPVRESGKVENSAPITIIGPKGSVSLSEGCIIAKRHIHMNENDANRIGVHDGQTVSVKASGDRGGILNNVQIRVHNTYSLEMHIDTDEANGFGIKCGSTVEIVK